MSKNKNESTSPIEEAKTTMVTEAKESEGTQGMAPTIPAPLLETFLVPGTVVYVGADIPAVATEGTIYNNGIPEELKAATEAHPYLKGLIVRVNDLAAAQKEIRTSGSALRLLYEKSKKVKEAL